MKYTLDLQGLKCPLPILKLQAFMKKLEDNEQVLVICTDPQTLNDIPSFCQAKAYKILEITTEQNLFYFKIKKGAS